MRVKKIMESIIPLSYQISEEEKGAFAKKFDDGSAYFNAYNPKKLYCLRCGTNSDISGHGEVRCENCGNTHVRPLKGSIPERVIRNCEIIEDFIIIKESVISGRETMIGLEIRTDDVS